MNTNYSLPKVAAWCAVIFCSLLPEILMDAAGIAIPAWWAWIQILLALTMLSVSMRVKSFAPLQVFFLFLVLYLLLWRGVTVIRHLPVWQQWESSTVWVAGISAIQGLKMGIALLLLVGLFFILRRRQVFFFTSGSASNPAQPVSWLGMKTASTWKRFGLIIALFFFLGGIAFLWLSNQPTIGMIAKTLPLLPFIILISATNAFSEEVMFRSTLLAPLETAIARSSALAIISVFFGLAHYSGSFPSGLVWVLLTGFLGFLFGKAMLETRGLGTSWFLHFISDIPVFFFTAVFSIQ
jgi:membrane protease YdiL (CAAX protease family)